MKRMQTGFTLIELAIVLTIIGLLIGGVLKGQEMINSAKVRNLTNDLKNIGTLLYTYQDKYRAVPGDDAGAAAHVGSVLAPAAATLGNGRINGAWNSTAGTDESFVFWNHVRLAGLAVGNPADPALPTNAVGGPLGVSSTSPITGQTGSYFACAGGVDGQIAMQADIAMDDGGADTGSVRAWNGGGTNPSTSYTAGTVYTVCLGF